MHFDPVVQVLIQVLMIIGLSRLMGLAFRRIKQPLVIGEIVAGIMLGPSFFGAIAPDAAAALFTPETIPYLGVLSQIGLIFFMFLIGLELDPKYLKNGLDTAVLISHVSILVPFSLGTLLALLLYPQVSNDSVAFTAFALFLGAAMSITAFPVLARILTENNLQNSRLGTLALTCAAVDDVTAWCLLALAIAVTRTNSMAGALPTMIQSVIYIGLMATLGRKLLGYLTSYYDRTQKLNQTVVALIYMGVVISALITELIGIHLIFGAFLFGAVMPKHQGLTRELAEKTEDFVLTFLLPIFFAYSGLQTQIGLLNSPILWALCLLVVAVAIVGKYAGTYVAARVSGIDKRESSALAWLMNTRGLTELIVLNIGLSLGVISPLLFTMLVIMALVTTFMTSPLLELTYPKHQIRKNIAEPAVDDRQPAYQILVPIANPSSQRGLIQLAMAIAVGNVPLQPDHRPAIVSPLSLIQLDEDYVYESTPAEADRLIAQRQAQLDELVKSIEPPEYRSLVRPIIQVSNDVARATANIASRDRVDLVVVGWHRPAFSTNRLGGRVGQILSTAPVDVAVYVDRQTTKLERLLLPYVSNVHTDLGLELALRLLINCENSHLTILRLASGDQPHSELSYEFYNLIERLPQQVVERISMPIIEAASPILAVVDASRMADLTIAGASREWGLDRQTLGRYADELAVRCRSSLLITRRYNEVASHLTSVLESPGIESVRGHEL
ncbi:sodium:proton antiporter [Phormidesmis priestleyi ULC007]|uniref:Sodium:proton antiporter n=1 Tax=Phormidesmis priestleyi ULC007 TaxID=1920490 RepID=A0A2T1D4I5_9CYAN|nr:cation:proton antiporter [Phormidesmis priestleyi]PSB15389.1 sodium:proton antiporter [Phormidesmis priestleyi ULC007]PZO46093.1 MAG: sodium:proton antiporter [Phormidesmis priestleyi]